MKLDEVGKEVGLKINEKKIEIMTRTRRSFVFSGTTFTKAICLCYR